MAITTAGNVGGTQLSEAILEVFSQEILFNAQPLLRYEQIATRKDELNVMPGLKINFLRYSSLTGGYTLTENTDIVPVAMSGSQLSITVGERGKAIQVTELLLRASFDDILASAARLLGMHYAKRRDAEIRDALLAGANVLYAKGRANRAALTATDYFDVDLIRDAVELLATNKAPKFNGDAYVCFIHPHQAKFLRKDPAWINASNYGAPEQLFVGEIGRIEDVRFIETTQQTRIVAGVGAQAVYADNEDTGTTATGNAAGDVYQAVIVGDHAVGLAISLEAEMRDNGVLDFGRKHAIGYYGIWGCGLIETGHTVTLETM